MLVMTFQTKLSVLWTILSFLFVCFRPSFGLMFLSFYLIFLSTVSLFVSSDSMMVVFMCSFMHMRNLYRLQLIVLYALCVALCTCVIYTDCNLLYYMHTLKQTMFCLCGGNWVGGGGGVGRIGRDDKLNRSTIMTTPSIYSQLWVHCGLVWCCGKKVHTW